MIMGINANQGKPLRQLYRTPHEDTLRQTDTPMGERSWQGMHTVVR